ncbi:hypothetical protein E3N88_23881 [Mikania micrantha]|uniref:Uncharacterized protein n=1 Tax=Mikania micrantha TaxID=192012 RepID=A0A5N6NG52_9ASTR|nr:hypothetical protein E3N88_23881 [Mikania micrantha]
MSSLLVFMKESSSDYFYKYMESVRTKSSEVFAFGSCYAFGSSCLRKTLSSLEDLKEQGYLPKLRVDKDYVDVPRDDVPYIED